VQDSTLRPGGWRDAWAGTRFRRQAWATCIALPLTLAALSRFLLWVEQRPGVVLDDPLLALLTPRDTSLASFALIYGGLLLALATLLCSPHGLLRALQAYVLLVGLRILFMWLTPLDPPEGLVPLRDPLVESLGPGATLTRDLFFSGHTSTLFLLALCVPFRWTRWVLLLATAGVAFLLLVQHAHYTVDVVVAPLAAYCAYVLGGRLSTGELRESG
jgi:hypothetical protein